MPPSVILASASPARQNLLRAAGVPFSVQPANVDEAAIKAANPKATMGDAALFLAEAKALNVPGPLVIGADQMLVCDDEWFDKPPTPAAARAQLARLRGRTHELISAIACARDGTIVWRHVARARMTMRDFSDAFLDHYLATEGAALLNSVGAYRLEGLGIQLFDQIEGPDPVILGLPLLPLLGFLRQEGVLMT
jgi:septum formation protein